MSLYHSAKYKLRNIQRTIESLLDGDFPLNSGKAALDKLRSVFLDFEEKLERAQRLNDDQSLSQIAQFLNVKIYQTLPILGFILRSTNVRNAFEMAEPLHSIAKSALQGSPQLILSSEWDYVPFAYPQSIENLKSFILIGLPASEAASALLMPLAGHELGHAVWRNRGIGANVQSVIQNLCSAEYSSTLSEFKKTFKEYKEDDLVGRNIYPEAIAESALYAGRQAEELFSDLFAYACFGPSYLRAFGYILAPGEAKCDAKYPLHSTRVDVIRQFAKLDGLTLPTFKELGFRPHDRRGDLRHKFIISNAELAVSKLIESLWEYVTTIFKKEKIVRPDSDRARDHLRNFELGIPSPLVVCVGDVINAGWQRYDEIIRETQDAQEIPEKLSELNEILLKTIEVFEYRRRVS